MTPSRWMKRTAPEVLGALAAVACIALGVRAFLAGNVPAEVSWVALAGVTFTFGRLLGTGRGWALWGVFAVVASAALWWAVHPAVGALVAVAVIGASVVARRILSARAGATRYLMHLSEALAKATKDRRDPEEILTPLPGKLVPNDETRTGASVGLPVRWNTPPNIPVDERARLLLMAAVAEVCRVPVTFRTKRNHIDVLPAPRPEATPDVDADEAEQVGQINEAIQPAMGPELSVKQTEREDDGTLVAVTLTWPPKYTNKAMNNSVRNRVGKALTGVVGGAWRSAGWSTEERTATYRRMRELPRKIPHPGRDDKHPERVQFATLRNGGTAFMSLGDENPHCLIAGTTSRGKTSLIRALLIGLPEAARADLVDPKRASMLGMDQLPMVTGVATRPETMAASIQTFRQEMLDRYERLEGREATVKELQRSPRVLVIDEAEMLFDMLDDWWRTEEKDSVKEQHSARAKLKAELIKEQGQVDGETDVDKLPPLPSPSGTRHPAIMWFKNILQAGRQAGMYVIMASQQNDASWLGTSARNQFGTRISLGNLDQVGSRQVFGTMGATSGLDSYQGRAWVGMGSGAIYPEQAQTWWVPELDADASDEDREILERLGLVVHEDAPRRELSADSTTVSERAPGAQQATPEAPGSPDGEGGSAEPTPAPAEPPEPSLEPREQSQTGDDPQGSEKPPEDPRNVSADHDTDGKSTQVNSTGSPGQHEPIMTERSDDEGAPVTGDRHDVEDDRPSGETERVTALDLEEGDTVLLDLGEGELEAVEVVSVEVDMHDTEQLEVTYRKDDDEAVLSLPEDDPVDRYVS